MFQRIFVFLLFLSLLGCQPIQGEEVAVERPSTTPSATATATVVSPTATSHPTQTATITALPTATPTVALPTPTPVPTVMPTMRPATLPIEQEYPLPAQEYEIPELDSFVTGMSPDGQWQAVYQQSDPIETETDGYIFFTSLVIERVDGTASWTAVEEWRYDGLGYITPAVYRWGSDSSVYITDTPHPDGCGGYYAGDSLRKLSLETGEITPILPHGVYIFVLAPDEQTVAYSFFDHIVLRSTDETPTEQYLTSGLSAWYKGPLYWSPDEQQLVLTTWKESECNGLEEQVTAVHLINFNTDSIQTIWQAEELFAIAEWADDQTIRLVTNNDQPNLLYDLQTQAVTEE